MNDRSEFEDLGLPPDLAELDAELSSLRYEERPSFGPELEAELVREWARMPRQAVLMPRRHLAAAAVVALFAVGLGVPQARASLVRLVNAIQGNTAQASSPTPDNPAALPLLRFDPPEVVIDGGEPEGPPVVPSDPPPAPAAIERYSGPEATFPELEDRDRVESIIREYYPMDLQREGVGGTARLLLWVDSTGAVDFVNLGQGSGVPDLDRAALAAAPRFRFTPARRRGRAVGTWVEFDVIFQPNPDEFDPFTLPTVDPIEGPEAPEVLDLSTVPEWTGDVVLPSPAQREAGELLRAAVDDDDALEALGSVESILAGDAPAGVAPTTWRGAVTDMLEEAMVRDPDNPAPLLALARIRRKQGLKTEARLLFDRGLQRAMRGGEGVSPTLLAEFLYERGTLVREGWLGQRSSGRVPAGRLAVEMCPQARSSGEATAGYASVDRLFAWNYLCPVQLGEVFTDFFEPTDRAARRDLEVMMASFRTAVEADPAHVGANVEVLLALADEGRWGEVLDGARRFIWSSRGHPYGLLISGIALQRLSRTEEAEGQFRVALRGLPLTEASELEEIRLLLGDREDEYAAVSDDARQGWVDAFWAPLDPILTSPVNERRVEHLARSAYAHLRFGGAFTDPGEVWVRYGRPDEVRMLRESGGLRTEFWDYGNGPDITFRRMASSDDMSFTEEARAYMADLLRVFPHRYGTASRTVFTLPGQLSRFRSDVPGQMEVEIHTEVPRLIATGVEDTLDLGVFLLGTDGERLGTTMRRIPARLMPLSFRAPVNSGVRGVVVEVFNRRTGQAAALRGAVVPTTPGVGGATISDLLLVASASPSEGDVDRRASWVKPQTLMDPVTGEAFGVLFELYDLPQAATSYQVRAEVVDRDTGEVRRVPIRPAGQEGFRTVWNRRSAEEGPTREFLTVALSDVPAGRYTLRLVVDLPEAGVPLVSQRNLDRR